MKVIQDALLYNKIRLSVTVKEYKEVSLSLSEVALAPQLHVIPSTGCLEGRQSRITYCGNNRKQASS